jgi:hypothetical protein
MGFWCWFCYFKLKRNQQIELFVWLVIPELSCSNRCPLVQQGHMLAITRIGNDHTPFQGQDAHLVIWLEAIITLIVIDQRGGHILRRLVQTFVAFLGMTCRSCSMIVSHLCPERLVGSAYLPRNIRCHLCRQAIPCTYLIVRFIAQAYLIAHLAMLKRVATHVVQGITIRETRSSQCLELCRVGLQFEFGGDDLLHRNRVL